VVSGLRDETVWIGFDPRETAAFAIARMTCRENMTRLVPVRGLVLSKLQKQGLYRRPIEMRASAADRPVMWDLISGAPQSTEHANSRFLVPYLAKTGWAVFSDGDVLFKGNVCRLLESLDPRYAIYCVRHDYSATPGIKMDGQVQTQYGRKNWSSFVVFNCDHPSNRCLVSSTDMANTLPGRDLHRFCWLKDDEIGTLSPSWNYLVGETKVPVERPDMIHFTLGVPDMPGYENCEFADEWRAARERWAD